jgi:hypothetical protein
MIGEGNKDRDVRHKLSLKVIERLKLWQEQHHPFKAIPRVQHMLLNAWQMTETEQWDMSILLEPRKKQDPTPQELYVFLVFLQRCFGFYFETPRGGERSRIWHQKLVIFDLLIFLEIPYYNFRFS